MTSDPSESEVFDLAAAYVDRINAGERIQPEEIVRAHPGALGESVLKEVRSFVAFGADEADASPLGAIGDYELLRTIGRGGMGVVYEAWDRPMDRRVALKVLPAAAAFDERAFQRFLREARTVGKLSHQSVVQVYAVGSAEHTPYFAMEFVEGETLAELLRRKRKHGEELPFGGPETCADYFKSFATAFAELAEGLQHAHSQGVIHRDLKPSNLMFDRRGNPMRLRLLDFGLARLEGQESLTATGGFIGTPRYTSPEQAAAGSSEVDHRSDIYSLGATAYETLTLRPPFEGKDREDTLHKIITRDPVAPNILNSRVPRDLAVIALKCLRKDPADRYGTAEALAQDLRRFARGDPIEARPEAVWERLGRQLRRRRVPLALAASCLFLLIFTVWSSWEAYAERHRRLSESYPSKVREAYFGLASRGWRGPQTLTGGGLRTPVLPYGPHGPISLVDLYGRAKLEDTPWIHEIVRDLEKLTEDLPEKRDGHYVLALAYRALGDTQRAQAAIERLRRVDPNFAPAERLWLELEGLMPWELDKPLHSDKREWEKWEEDWLNAQEQIRYFSWQKALDLYDDLLARCRDDWEPYLGFKLDAYLIRGAIYLELAQWKEAQRQFIRASTIAPRCLEAQLLEAKADYLDDDPERAEKAFLDLAESTELAEGSDPEFWIAAIYISLEDWDHAENWIVRVTEPATQALLRTSLNLENADWSEAVETGIGAVEQSNGSLSAHQMLATAILSSAVLYPSVLREHVSRLVESCLTAVELSPHDLRSRWLLKAAWQLVSHGDAGNDLDNLRQLRLDIEQAAVSASIDLTCVEPPPSSGYVESFEAGELVDGRPVCWENTVYCPGDLVEIEGGQGVYIENKPLELGIQAGFGPKWIYWGDVTVLVRGSFNNTARAKNSQGFYPSIGPSLHFSYLLNGYEGWVFLDGTLCLMKFPDYTCLDSGRLSFEPTNEELYIELRRVGAELEFRVWRALSDDPLVGRPDEANLHAFDDSYQFGQVGISGAYNTPGAAPIVRWVSVRTP